MGWRFRQIGWRRNPLVPRIAFGPGEWGFHDTHDIIDVRSTMIEAERVSHGSPRLSLLTELIVPDCTIA
jgi:hypothetical protein